MLLLSAEASSKALLRGTRELDMTNMVSLTFCESSLPAEDTMPKKTLEEVHTYAELKHDPRTSLPDSFTVCSTIMATNCQYPQWTTFLSILNQNRDQFLVLYLIHGFIKSKFKIGSHKTLQVLIGK